LERRKISQSLRKFEMTKECPEEVETLPSALKKPSALKNALIATIGSETNNNGSLADAIFASIDPAIYDIAVLIASPESTEGAQKIAQRLNWPAEALEIEVLQSAHDLDEVFRTVNSCINRLIAHGYTPNRITINYTSGTKVMSSGAVLCAIFNSCDSLQYITGAGGGGRRQQQTLFTRPRSIFAYQELMRARNHLLARQFGSSAQALKLIDGSLLSDYDHSLADKMLHLVNAYSAWEANLIEEFLREYDKVEFNQMELMPFQISADQRELIEKLAEDFRQRVPSPALCIEMRNSALRLLMTGDADDATERLYRALEILAQWKLATKYDAYTDDLDIRKVPPRYRTLYDALRSMDDGKVRIGLRKSYELLALLEDPTGADFAADTELQQSIKNRDLSLLAHGVTPMSVAEGRSFMERATKFIQRQIPDFTHLCKALQFPWINQQDEAFVCQSTEEAGKHKADSKTGQTLVQ